MGYAGVAGIVEWIVLTDGNEYRIYNAYAPVPIDQKLFKRVVVASDEPGLTETLGLLSKAQLQGTVIDDLWRAYFVDRQVKKAVEDLSGLEAPTDFVNLVRKRVPRCPRLKYGRAWDAPRSRSTTRRSSWRRPSRLVRRRRSAPAAAVSIAAKDAGDKDPGATRRRGAT